MLLYLAKDTMYRHWLFPSVLLVLCGCIGIHDPIRVSVNHYEQQQQLAVSASILDNQRSTELFGAELTEYMVVPVCVQIHNNGPHTYTMYPSYIDVPQVDIAALCEQLHYDTSWYAMVLTVPSFIWLWQAIPLVVVPACMQLHAYNQRITTNVRKYAFSAQEALVIHPYEQVKFLILLDATSYTSHISMRIFDNYTQELLPFDIALKTPRHIRQLSKEKA